MYSGEVEESLSMAMGSTGDAGTNSAKDGQSGRMPLQVVVARLHQSSSIAPTLSPTAATSKLEKRYYIVTWIAFFCILAFLVLIETGLIVASHVRAPFSSYHYMEPVIRNLTSTIQILQNASTPAVEKASLMSSVLLSKRQLKVLYEQYRGDDQWTFWVNLYANTVVCVLIIAAWIACYVFRNRPTMKARGWFFINQLMFGLFASLVCLTLLLADIVGYLDPKGDYLDVSSFPSMETARDALQRMVTRHLVNSFFICVFLTMAVSSVAQRQRIIYLMFRNRSLQILGRYEYYKPLMFTSWSALFIYSGNLIWVCVAGMQQKYRHVIIDIYGLWALFFVILIYKYSQIGMAGAPVDLRFMDYHNNMRTIVSLFLLLLIQGSLAIVFSRQSMYYFIICSIARLLACIYILDGLATQIAYEVILAPSLSRFKRQGPVSLGDLKSTASGAVTHQASSLTKLRGLPQVYQH